ncbi:MAG: peptide chain release factor 2 [Spirochaetes bacterium]|nr:peptide chain release factor 2 [Spirochaetota bacterium]
MLSDYKTDIYELQKKCQEYLELINIESIEKEIAELEEKTKDENFWDDQNQAQSVLKKIAALKRKIDPWLQFKQETEDLVTLFEMSIEEDTQEFETEIAENLKKLTNNLSELELLQLFSGENDSCNAIVNIHPGAGGTEACDWASMLFRMYKRWVENHGFKLEIMDWLAGDEAGVKNVTFLVKGENAYGFLKYESGIHRLVRISPFDSNARRHTSFASIYTTPDIEDEVEIEIKPEELRIDTYRAGGAGGQHVNKTDSAVRITHNPTGIVVTCQNERSQLKNKNLAMKILKARLYDHYQKLQEEEKQKNNPEKKDIAWGSQIRSYIFQPYTMVKDHRTKIESGNIQAVMDGEIDDFLINELKFFSNY